MSSNNLKAVPKVFFDRCRQCEALNVSNNTIAMMPEVEGTIRLYVVISFVLCLKRCMYVNECFAQE